MLLYKDFWKTKRDIKRLKSKAICAIKGKSRRLADIWARIKSLNTSTRKAPSESVRISGLVPVKNNKRTERSRIMISGSPLGSGVAPKTYETIRQAFQSRSGQAGSREGGLGDEGPTDTASGAD